MGKPLDELAREALAVQDACNLCGVAQAFARAMIDLGEHTNGTDERNRHPITRVWVNKLGYLSGANDDVDVMDAFRDVRDLAEGKTTPVEEATTDEIKVADLRDGYYIFGNKGNVWSNYCHIYESTSPETLCGVPMLSNNWASHENVEVVRCADCIDRYNRS